MSKKSEPISSYVYKALRDSTYGCSFNGFVIKEYGGDADRRQFDSDIGYYYAAGWIEEYSKSDEPNTAQFIILEINGLPVLELGYSVFMNTIGIQHGSSTLEKVYLPSTIIYMNAQYFSRNDGSLGDDINWFYCGELMDLSAFNIYGREKVYVPNEKYSEFVELLPEDAREEILFYKANDSYRLNVQELPQYYQTEYYYVDYVEYREIIENIPPEPIMSGYKFGGWYTETDCTHQWDFANAIPQLAESEDFNELCLYAKWIKK